MPAPFERMRTMKTWIRTCSLVATLVLCAFAISGCATVAAHHDFNPNVNFDQYKSFAWISANPLVDPAPSVGPQIESKLQQTAKDLLTAKGYRFVDDPLKADFVVGFGLGATDKVRIDAYPATYRGPWHWPASHDAAVRQHVEGRLVVDIFDVKTRQPAWHGWATRSLSTSGKKDPQPAIRAALTAIFANFPPG
jgi:hypothetical protein